MMIPDAPGDGTPGPDMVDDGQARVSMMREVEAPRPGSLPRALLCDFEMRCGQRTAQEGARGR